MGFPIDPHCDQQQPIGLQLGDITEFERAVHSVEGCRKWAGGVCPSETAICGPAQFELLVVGVLRTADSVGGQEAAVGQPGQRWEGRYGPVGSGLALVQNASGDNFHCELSLVEAMGRQSYRDWTEVS